MLNSPQKHALLLDPEALLAWYDRHARALPWRISPSEPGRGVMPDPYRVWLSEIMLQQTTVAAVIPFYQQFLAIWPSVEALAASPLEAVLAEWAGLGYYARARNLHACACAIVERYGGQFPNSAAALQQLPGIGAYTGAAIAAICFDEPVAVLDGNVERVLARVKALRVPPSVARKELRDELQTVVPERAGDFAQGMMDLGATICTPRATFCMLCPLRGDCKGYASGAPLDFPVKVPKAEKPTRYGHAFVLRDKAGRVFLRQRGPKGLLAKMTETPTGDWASSLPEPEFPVAADWQHMGQVVHVFTHFRLELDVWTGEVKGPAPGEGWWADPEELGQQALPTLFRRVLKVGGIAAQAKR